MIVTYIVRVHRPEDRSDVVADLSRRGTARPYSAIPDLLEWDGPEDAEEWVLAIPGVQSIVRDLPVYEMSTHVVSPGLPAGVQLPILMHGQRPGEMLYNSAYDLAWPGQEVVFDYDPTFGVGDGTGTTLYMVDSGVDPDHPELDGRVSGPIYAIDTSPTMTAHGTTCATIAAGVNLGVAPGADVVDARIFRADGVGNSTWSLNGMNESIQHYQNGSVPGVMNMSFGSVDVSGVDMFGSAVTAAVNSGLIPVAAAGNNGRDLTGNAGNDRDLFPAESVDAFTVGGLDEHMKVHRTSNRGNPVNMWASFHAYTTAAPDGTVGGSGEGRGTSYAAPLITGMMLRALTNTTKMTSRAEVQAFLDQFVEDYGVEDVRTFNNQPLRGARRLYIPGVSRTGLQFRPPTII